VLEDPKAGQLVKLAANQAKKSNKPKEVDSKEKELEDDKRRYQEMERRIKEAEQKAVKSSVFEAGNTEGESQGALQDKSKDSEICNYYLLKVFR
jgi:hypothetical protein